MKSFFSFSIFVSLFLISVIVFVSADAVPSQPSLIRFWGLLENEAGDMANCNLLETPLITLDGTDITYSGVVGFSGRNCYYSIDVLASEITNGANVLVELEGVESSEISYSGISPTHADVTIELDASFFEFVDGCMDSSAVNYDATANFDDGSCDYSGCTDSDAFNYDIYATINDDSCLYVGCTDSDANNYDPEADINLGCTYDDPDPEVLIPSDIPGCIDPDAYNFDELATIDDGSCEYIGCTDSDASNYDSDATLNSGCTYDVSDPDPEPILGCTDIAALNYNSLATQNDYSCAYEEDVGDTTDDTSTSTATTKKSTGSSKGTSTSISWSKDDANADEDADDTDATPQTDTDISGNQALQTSESLSQNSDDVTLDATSEKDSSSSLTGKVISVLQSKKSIPYYVFFAEIVVIAGVIITLTTVFMKRRR